MRLIESISPHVSPLVIPGFDDYDDLWNEVDRILGVITSKDDVNSDDREHTIFELVQLVISTSLELNQDTRTINKEVSKEADDRVAYLLRLARMEDSWYDEDSRAPSDGAILKAIEILHLVTGLDDLVSSGPIYEGGVIIEYRAKNWDYSLEVFNSGKIEFYGVETNGEGETELIEFNDVSEQLIRKISMSIR